MTSLWRSTGLAISAFKELAAFVLDKDKDDDEWGESQITRQGLLQDLGILDVIVQVLSDPMKGIKDKDLNNDTLKELQVRARAYFTCVHVQTSLNSEPLGIDVFRFHAYMYTFAHACCILLVATYPMVLRGCCNAGCAQDSCCVFSVCR